MGSSSWLDADSQRLAMEDVDMLTDTTLNTHAGAYIFPLSQIVPDNGWVVFASSPKIRLNERFA